jgi:hypothetical protein
MKKLLVLIALPFMACNGSDEDRLISDYNVDPKQAQECLGQLSPTCQE